MKSQVRNAIAAASVVGLSLGMVACSSGGSDSPSSGEASGGQVEIEFFQNKREAVDTYNKLIEMFEADNPEIKVTQTNSPEAETVFQSRLASGDVPDVAALGSQSYAQLVAGGVLQDLSGSEAVKEVSNEKALTDMQLLGLTDQTYALPMSVNSLFVLYNQEKWDALGLEEPNTWTEFIELLDTIKAAGETPIYFTILDAWTAQGLGNGISASVRPDGFIQDVRDGSANFADSEAMRETAEKIVELSSYAQPDAAGRSYDDGNIAFANGESVLYIQGNWTIAPLLELNPDLKLGAFGWPGTDNEDQNKIVSGPDQLLGIPVGSKNPEAAEKFLTFLLSKDAQQLYSDEQTLYSVRNDVPPSNETVRPIYDNWVTAGRTALPLDAYFGVGSDYAAVTQQLFTSGDVDGYLSSLQQTWDSFGLK